MPQTVLGVNLGTTTITALALCKGRSKTAAGMFCLAGALRGG